MKSKPKMKAMPKAMAPKGKKAMAPKNEFGDPHAYLKGADESFKKGHRVISSELDPQDRERNAKSVFNDHDGDEAGE